MNLASNSSAFEPRELAFLQKLFRQVCTERGVPGDSSDASDLAVRIISLYQQGIRDEKSLHSELDGTPAGHG